MPPRKPKTFKLKLSVLRAALAKSHSEAEKAVKFGEQAVAAARRRGDKKALKDNTETLRLAKKSRKNLADSINKVADSCCDQFLNCDPTYS